MTRLPRPLSPFASLVMVGCVLAATGCATVQTTDETPWRRPEVQPAAVDPTTLDLRFAEDEAYAYFDGKTGARVSFDDVIVRADASQVVLLGEEHDQIAHHELQRRVVAVLAQHAQARGTALALGLEMLTRDKQSAVDALNSGALDLPAFADAVDWKKAWGFAYDMYRPVLEAARTFSGFVVPLNAPRSLVQAVRKKGLNGLNDAERRDVPDMDLGDGAHRAWFTALLTTSGHPLTASDLDGYYTAQVLWDETMASSVVAVLGKAQGVVVLCGNGHIARGRGIPQRVERRGRDVRVLSVVQLSANEGDVAGELAAAIHAGEGDILVLPRFEIPLAL